MKKSQISIFIILALMSVSLLIFLITTNIDEKTKVISSERTIQNLETNNKLFPLKDNVDFCLLKNLRKATIISGLRGGFILDKSGSYFSSGGIPNGTYDSEFISNQGLNWNELSKEVLIYHKSQTKTPSPPEKIKTLKNGIKIFNTSIKNDYEKFILNEFISCIKLDDYEEEGYNLSYEKFIGKKTQIKTQNNLIIFNSDLKGKNGDLVKYIIDGIEYYGTITKQLNANEVEITPLNPSTKLQTGQSEISFINLNSTISVDVEFSDESINAKLNFPVKISKGQDETSYEQSKVSLNVRFKELLNIAGTLLRQKEINRSLDYSNKTDLIFALRNNYYLKNSKLQDFKLLKTYINSSEEKKFFIYSIIDDESKILGKDFVFNFGYENTAPLLNISEIGGEIYLEEGVSFITAINNPVRFNLSSVTYEKQILDKWNYFFIISSPQIPGATLSISPNGILNFYATESKKYSYEIKVTDGEATLTKQLVFIAGFPENTLNKAAKECFSINSFSTSTYPIERDLKNKIFSIPVIGQKEKTYSYILNPLSLLDKPKKTVVKFKKSCQFNPDLYPITVTLNNNPINPSNFNKDTGEITIPFSSGIQNLKVEVKDKNSGTLMTDAYELDLYPASCLGPANLLDSRLGGTGSCCNLEPVYSSIKNKVPKALSNIIGANKVVINARLYLCYDTFSESRENKQYIGKKVRPNVESIWDLGGSDITSQFNANLKVKCDGTSPVGSQISLSPISGDTKVITITGNSFGPLPRPISATLGITHRNNICEFCHISNSELYLYTANGLKFKAGLISQNPPPVGQIPLGYSQSDFVPINGPIPSNLASLTRFGSPSSYYFRRDNYIYGSVDKRNWFNSVISKGGVPNSIIYKAEKYCAVGSSIKSRYKITNYKRDDSDSCQDWYFNGTKLIKQPNTGWICGDYISAYNCTSLQPASIPTPIYSNKICNAGKCPIKANIPNPGPCP